MSNEKEHFCFNEPLADGFGTDTYAGKLDFGV